MAWFLVVVLAGLLIASSIKKSDLSKSNIDLRIDNERLISENRILENANDRAEKSNKILKQDNIENINQIQILRKKNEEFIQDAQEEKKRLRQQFESNQASLKAEYQAMQRQLKESKAQAESAIAEKRQRVEDLLTSANEQAAAIIAAAKASAEGIAGNAYQALNEANALQESAKAMKNIIEGYGYSYLKPTQSLLDELAQTYGFDDAGKQLKMARERTALMVVHGRAAASDYVQLNRSETALAFILDAFNGKVDSILSKSKKDNYGTLEQQIKDAYALVNHNGVAFRNTKITPEYLDARLQELRWATAVLAVREREREEQRAIREQIREEERTRREIERALKDAAKEEATIEKAMEKARQQVARANEEQRQRFEDELQALQQRLQEAEARNQRALSMAQQTKAGHVYIISNIGSFGENVFKVGMTRRLEPLDRVRELGDASVPFAFDVHAMMWSEDAPALERALHIEFAQMQVNKVNPRKEFFRVNLADLRAAVEERGLEVSWTMAAAAAEYRETLAIEQGMAQSDVLAQDWLRKQADFENREVLALSDSED